MAQVRRRFERELGERRYKKLFVIAAEGSQTEQQYFSLFTTAVVRVECLRSGKASSPPQVLARMRRRLKEINLRPEDEAWLVIDKDQWLDAQIDELAGWTDSKRHRFLALSNPKFEYWLLLHFDDGARIRTSTECDARLGRFLPDYDKGIDHSKFPPTAIREAVERASRRDTPRCSDWPRRPGCTTVYRLVERILAAAQD